MCTLIFSYCFLFSKKLPVFCVSPIERVRERERNVKWDFFYLFGTFCQALSLRCVFIFVFVKEYCLPVSV